MRNYWLNKWTEIWGRFFYVFYFQKIKQFRTAPVANRSCFKSACKWYSITSTACMYATDCATITERLKSTNLKNWTCSYIQEHAQSHYSLLYLFCVVGVRKLPNKMLSLCLTHTLSRMLSRFCDFSSDIPLFSIAFSFFCLKNPIGNQWIFVLYVFVHTEFWKKRCRWWRLWILM